MKKRIFCLLLVLFSVNFIYASATEYGYSKYNHSDRTCIVDGPWGDEFGQIDLGWKSDSKDSIHISTCHDWSDPACCEDICNDYNQETKRCLIKEDILDSMSIPNNNHSFIGYGISIILIVLTVLYFTVRKK